MTSTERKSRSKVEILAGFATGVMQRFFVHPVDTLKAKLQVNQQRLGSWQEIRANGITRLVASTWQNEGIRGFYKGMGVTILFGGPAASLYFSTYSAAKQYLAALTGVQNSFFVGFVSGMIAETVSCVLWVPIDVIKERLQVQSTLKTYQYRNSWDALGQIYRKEGLRTLYRAYGATVMAFGPFLGFSIAFYDKVKNLLGYDKVKIGFWQSIILSTTSGVFGAVVTNPIDIVKVRMQVQRAELQSGETLENGRFGYKNMFHGIGKLLRDEGPLGLFKGIYARILLGAISAGTALTINDLVKGALKADDNAH